MFSELKRLMILMISLYVSSSSSRGILMALINKEDAIHVSALLFFFVQPDKPPKATDFLFLWKPEKKKRA
ncbi:hypothetical protein SLEP1_g27734 [Rubroshorea leprosula]|uniref:Uncharacterized protein n=1 Tax=Rubroshorea leprosula TaxID=152421 RepID=A0AAV5JRC0_9ROSI|nr:hypothetical protein SLEP1_g27734 [Rubroshorea leprosula]